MEIQGNYSEDEKFELNQDHTHYIIVKDKTINKNGINLFAMRLFQYLSCISGRAEFASDVNDNQGIYLFKKIINSFYNE